MYLQALKYQQIEIYWIREWKFKLEARPYKHHPTSFYHEKFVNIFRYILYPSRDHCGMDTIIEKAY